LRQVILQFFTFLSHASGTGYGVFGGLDGLMTLIVGTCANDGLIEGFHLAEETSLVGEDG
jgi:hypothetical protein